MISLSMLHWVLFKPPSTLQPFPPRYPLTVYFLESKVRAKNIELQKARAQRMAAIEEETKALNDRKTALTQELC